MQRGWLRATEVGPRGEQAVELTADGAALLRAVAPAWRAAERAARAGLGAGHARALARAGDAWLRGAAGG